MFSLMRVWIVAGGLATLAGCFGTETTNPEPMPDVWLEFERAVPEGPTRFRWYVAADGDYTSIVASEQASPSDTCAPGDEQCTTLPPGSLAAGPRLTGTVDAADMERLRALLDVPALRIAYLADGHPLGTLDPARERLTQVSVGAHGSSGPMSVEFADAATQRPETTEFLTTLTTLHRRYHGTGTFAEESDRARAAEREWPVP